MTIRKNTLTDGSVTIKLANMDDWDAFKMENASEILAEYGSFRSALRAAESHGMMIGGGAAPLTCVYFLNDEQDAEDLRDKCKANLSEGW